MVLELKVDGNRQVDGRNILLDVYLFSSTSVWSAKIVCDIFLQYYYYVTPLDLRQTARIFFSHVPFPHFPVAVC